MAPPPHPGPRPQFGPGITLLGARQTGKTTFLAALQLALLRRPALGWALRGESEASAKALTDFVIQMTDKHIFPDPSTQIEEYKWSLEADLPRAIKEWHWWGFRRRDQYIRIPIELVDAPGEAFDSENTYSQESFTQLVGNMAQSAGIVLFLDPIREFERGDAFRHMFGVLTQLKTQLQPLLPGHSRLPHYVAVCITKFDEIPVFEAADKLRVTEFDPEPPELPQVPEHLAREFFTRLVNISRSDTAGLVLPMLEQTFRKERIKFFITSAIGFYVAPEMGVFDPDDYQNHIPGDPDHIRGGIYPINIIEPVVWLGRNVARTAR